MIFLLVVRFLRFRSRVFLTWRGGSLPESMLSDVPFDGTHILIYPFSPPLCPWRVPFLLLTCDFMSRRTGGGVKQYYLPDLANANETYTPKWELEYMTYGLSVFEKNGSDEAPEVIPWENIPKSLRKGRGAKYAPYSMDDLTIPSWIELARKLGDGKNRGLRKNFRKYMFMGHGEEVD